MLQLPMRFSSSQESLEIFDGAGRLVGALKGTITDDCLTLLTESAHLLHTHRCILKAVQTGQQPFALLPQDLSADLVVIGWALIQGYVAARQRDGITDEMIRGEIRARLTEAFAGYYPTNLPKALDAIKTAEEMTEYPTRKWAS